MKKQEIYLVVALVCVAGLYFYYRSKDGVERAPTKAVSGAFDFTEGTYGI